MDEQLLSPLLEDLLDRLEAQESLEVEFKKAKGGLPKSAWETVSAFANTMGGWIILGVSEKDDTVQIEGIGNGNALLKDFNDLLRNKTKINFPVCGANDASFERLGSKQLLVIRVPAAPRKERPIYIDNNPYTGTYLRRHSADYHCSKP